MKLIHVWRKNPKRILRYPVPYSQPSLLGVLLLPLENGLAFDSEQVNEFPYSPRSGTGTFLKPLQFSKVSWHIFKVFLENRECPYGSSQNALHFMPSCSLVLFSCGIVWRFIQKCELKKVLLDLTSVQNMNLHSGFFSRHHLCRNPCSHGTGIRASFWWVSLTAEYNLHRDVRKCPHSNSVCGLEHLLLVSVCIAVLWQRSSKCQKS